MLFLTAMFSFVIRLVKKTWRNTRSVFDLGVWIVKSRLNWGFVAECSWSGIPGSASGSDLTGEWCDAVPECSLRRVKWWTWARVCMYRILTSEPHGREGCCCWRNVRRWKERPRSCRGHIGGSLEKMWSEFTLRILFHVWWVETCTWGTGEMRNKNFDSSVYCTLQSLQYLRTWHSRGIEGIWNDGMSRQAWRCGWPGW